MAKFKFRLATLQKLRESHRDEMRSKLAEAYQAEQLLQQQVAAIHQEEAKLKQAQRESFANPSTDVNRLLNAQRYSAALKSQLNTIADQSKLLLAEIEKRRQALISADQQVRVLEKLHERQLETHRLQQLRVEEKVMDEIASRSQEVEL